MPAPLQGRRAGSRRHAGTSLTEAEYKRRRPDPIVRMCLSDGNERIGLSSGPEYAHRSNKYRKHSCTPDCR